MGNWLAGLADPRTIVVVLATIALSRVLGAFDPTAYADADPLQLFVIILVLVGYLYATRTLLRLPFQIWLALHEAVNHFRGKERLWHGWGYLEPSLRNSVFVFSLRIMDADYWEEASPETGLSESSRDGPGLQVFRVLDRLGLVALTFVATWAPPGLVALFGTLGLTLLLLVFCLRGSFSLLLADPVSRADKNQYQRLLSAAPSVPSTVYTRPAPGD